MNEKIKFVVVGCGHIGKRHAAMIVNNPDAALIALVDVLPKGELNLENYDLPFFNSIELFLASGIEFDVANIAAPNGLHASIALTFLNAGKDVVIEKPMTLTVSDAMLIKRVAEENGRNVFVVMQNRYSPPSVWLKSLVESGILGKIYLVQMNCFWNRDERYYTPDSWHGTKDLDGGTLFTQFSHFIDILYWVFGDIKNVKSIFRDFAHGEITSFEDSGILTFELESGGIGNLNFTTAVWDKNLESSLTVVAEKGSLKIGGQYMDKVEYCHIKEYEMPELAPTMPGNDYGVYKGSAANHHFIIENVIDVIRDGADITTTVNDGAKVVEIIEKMYRSDLQN